MRLWTIAHGVFLIVTLRCLVKVSSLATVGVSMVPALLRLAGVLSLVTVQVGLLVDLFGAMLRLVMLILGSDLVRFPSPVRLCLQLVLMKWLSRAEN